MITLTRIEIDNGLSALKCPVTGIDVFGIEQGFSSNPNHSPHLRFFIDWIGGMSVAEAKDLPTDQVEYLGKIHSLFNGDENDEMCLDEQIDNILEILPKSALVLEIVEPPRGGGHDGDTCYVGFDFLPLPPNSRVTMIDL